MSGGETALSNGRALAGHAAGPTHASSSHYSREYADLSNRYAGSSIDVSFRQLVGALPASEYTHGLYPYPARLLRHIPRFLLATDAVVDGIELVLDPFVGSGTVLLEAQLRGIASVGIEQNPVAALISRVKVRSSGADGVAAALEAILRDAKRSRRPTQPSAALGRWYSKPALSALGRLLTSANKTADPTTDVAMLCLALTAKQMATTDPRIPVPVRSRRNESATTDDVWEAWSSQAEALAVKLERLPRYRPSADVRFGDARNASTWPAPEKGGSSLLLSSPPYGAAQKYVRSTSLEAGWLGYAPSGRTVHMEHGSIGREHLAPEDAELNYRDIWSPQLRAILAEIGHASPHRKAIYLAYFADMQKVFVNAREAQIRRIALITGNNSVAGGVVHTSRHLAEIVQALGYRRKLSLRDPIRGRALLTTRRNGSPSAAEYIDIFEVDDNA